MGGQGSGAKYQPMNVLFRLPSILLSLSGACLCLAPFLTWMRLQVFGLHMLLPGFLWHGVWLGGVGGIILLLTLNRRHTSPLVPAALSLGGYALWQDYHLIWQRGDYFLAECQLKLAPFNQVLAQLNLASLEIYQRSNPADRLGIGIYLAAAGLALGLCGWFLALAGEMRRGSGLISLLLGGSRCRDCSCRLTTPMRFCPGCGRNRSGQACCARCGGELRQQYHFCPSCGEERSIAKPP